MPMHREATKYNICIHCVLHLMTYIYFHICMFFQPTGFVMQTGETKLIFSLFRVFGKVCHCYMQRKYEKLTVYHVSRKNEQRIV